MAEGSFQSVCVFTVCKGKLGDIDQLEVGEELLEVGLQGMGGG